MKQPPNPYDLGPEDPVCEPDWVCQSCGDPSPYEVSFTDRKLAHGYCEGCKEHRVFVDRDQFEKDNPDMAVEEATR